MSEVTDKVERALARFERVTQSLDARDGPARASARRERERLNSDMMRRARTIAVAVAMIAVLTIAIGLVMFGFLAAVAAGLAAIIALTFRSRAGSRRIASPSADLPNGEMVQRFDSYLYRSRGGLPAPAQAEIDAISAGLPTLKQTLERVDPLDPNAQDARRLMSVHLPGLLERYSHVPPALRSEADPEGKTVDDRLVEGLAASRSALSEIGESLAKADMAAFETQGRFIQSRYGQNQIDA